MDTTEKEKKGKEKKKKNRHGSVPVLVAYIG